MRCMLETTLHAKQKQTFGASSSGGNLNYDNDDGDV